MCSGIGLLAGQRTSSENSRAGAAYLGLPTFPDDTRQPASAGRRVCVEDRLAQFRPGVQRDELAFHRPIPSSDQQQRRASERDRKKGSQRAKEDKEASPRGARAQSGPSRPNARRRPGDSAVPRVVQSSGAQCSA